MKVLFLLFLSISLYAFEIEIEGNTKTQSNIIRIELADLTSRKIDSNLLDEIERRIWNLRLFSKVDIKPKDESVLITVSERWTTIPIAKFSSGGDSTYIALGAYDINTLGRNLEIGAQYEELNDRPAGVLWFRKPQFLDNRNLNIGMDFWTINRIRVFYDSNGEENGAFTLIRKRLNTFVEQKWDSDFFLLGLQFDFHNDEISEFGIGDELEDENRENNLVFDQRSISKFLRIYFRVGRVNFQNYLVDGSDVQVESAVVYSSVEDNALSDSKLIFRHFTLLPNHINVAWQFSMETTNLENIQYQKFVGGFSEVRGYRDGQFYDNAFWNNNVEVRFDAWENSLGVVQGAIFSDQAKEGESIKESFNSEERVLVSSGFGIRLISPKIFRFVARLDYAITHTRFIDQNLSFDIQQFF